MDVAETELQALYTWVDSIPLSRPKKNIARDFADGVLLAEVVHHFFPRLVELHNYSAAHGLAQKLYNWSTLNQKVFRRLGFILAKSEAEAAATCEAGAVERILKLVRVKLAAFAEQQEEAAAAPASAQEQRESRPAPQPPVPGSPTAHVSVRAAGARSPAPKGSGRNGGSQDAAQLKAAGGGARSETDEQLAELKEANEILTSKAQKLEQLVKLKEAKIQALNNKLAAAGLA